MKTKEHKEYRSPADWAEDQVRPWKKRYFEIELAATAAREAGNTDEERLLRKQARIIHKHIQRFEGLA